MHMTCEHSGATKQSTKILCKNENPLLIMKFSCSVSGEDLNVNVHKFENHHTQAVTITLFPEAKMHPEIFEKVITGLLFHMQARRKPP